MTDFNFDNMFSLTVGLKTILSLTQGATLANILFICLPNLTGFWPQ